jgi:hypothetical protein
MNVTLSPFAGAGAQFFDNSGNILSGGKIYTYEAGTTTPRATYTSASALAVHTNPIILDSAGRVPSGEIWLDQGLAYKFVVKDSNDVLIATYDNLIGINSNLVNFTYPQDFGAVGDGVTNDTVALTAFFNAIAGNDQTNGDIGDDSTYLFSQLIIPANVTIRGKSIFRANSSLSGTAATITVKSAFNADTLHLTTAGTETNNNLIVFDSDNVTIQNLIVESDVQFGGTGGIVCRGSNYKIDNLKTVFVPRPIQFQKAAPGLGAQENIRLGSVDIYGYIRGISMVNCNNWYFYGY